MTLTWYFKDFKDISQPVVISTTYKVLKAPAGCNGFPCPILDQRGKTSTTFEVAKPFSPYLSNCSKRKRQNISVELSVNTMWWIIWYIGFYFWKKFKMPSGSITFLLFTMNNYTNRSKILLERTISICLI